jgi:hypothetical protein
MSVFQMNDINHRIIDNMEKQLKDIRGILIF